MRTGTSLLLALILLAGCATGPRKRGATPDQQFMYGAAEPAAATPTPEDREYVAAMTAQWDTPERASELAFNDGLGMFQRYDYAGATQRFNQAWLLNPKNPDVYYGFALVAHDEFHFCEAKTISDRALALGLSKATALADTGHYYSECAVVDKTLDEKTKAAMIEESEALYTRADQIAPSHVYVLESWARTRCVRKDWAGCEAMATKARDAGVVFSGTFEVQLRDGLANAKLNSAPE